MSAPSISSSYLSTVMLQPIAQAQTALAAATTELSSGQYANFGLQLGEQSGQELSLRNQSDLLSALTAANGLTTTNISAATSALDQIRTNAGATVSTLAGWSPGDSTSASLQTLGENALEELTANANTTSSGGYVFGGENSGTAPLSDYFSTPQSSAQDRSAPGLPNEFRLRCRPIRRPQTSQLRRCSNFSTGPFTALFQGAGWTTNFSSASSVNATAEIAPGETVETGSNANEPGFQQLTQAYAMMAEFGGSQLSNDALQTVATTAAALISQGQASMTTTEASLGAAQARVTDANTSMASQSAILQTRIGDLDNVNSSEVATQVTSLQTEIQTAYDLTARLQQLNLAQYLPVS